MRTSIGNWLERRASPGTSCDSRLIVNLADKLVEFSVCCGRDPSAEIRKAQRKCKAKTLTDARCQVGFFARAQGSLRNQTKLKSVAAFLDKLILDYWRDRPKLTEADERPMARAIRHQYEIAFPANNAAQRR